MASLTPLQPALGGRTSLGAAAASLAWTITGRGPALVWTGVLLARVGLDGYGSYAVAVGAGAVVAVILDHPFAARSVRIDPEHFQTERAGRAVVGWGLLLAGLTAGLAHVPFVAWFALCFAGSEVLFQAVMSTSVRDGLPQRLNRAMALRQASASACGLAALTWMDAPNLGLACAAYLVPNVVFGLRAAPLLLGRRFAGPGPWRGAVVLSMETVAFAAAAQGDVILLAVVADDRSVGMYALGMTVAWALAAVGQAYGQAHHASLREDGAGPSPRLTLLISGAVTIAMAAGALVMAVAGSPAQLVASTAVLSLFAGLRSYSHVLLVILNVRALDRERLIVAAVGAALRLGTTALFVALAPQRWAAVAAAGAAVAVQTVDCLLLLRLVRASTPASDLT